MTDRSINSKQNRTRKNKGTPNIKHFSFPSFQHFENRLKKREVFLEKKNRKRDIVYIQVFILQRDIPLCFVSLSHSPLLSLLFLFFSSFSRHTYAAPSFLLPSLPSYLNHLPIHQHNSAIDPHARKTQSLTLLSYQCYHERFPLHIHTQELSLPTFPSAFTRLLSKKTTTLGP